MTACAATTYSKMVNLTGKLEQLKLECKALQKRYISNESIKTRSSQVNKYYKFCEEFDLDPIPCPTYRVAWYVTWMTRTLKAVSIRNYVTGLSEHLKGEGAPSVDYGDVGISRCIAASSRTLGEEVRRAAPILPGHMVKMFTHITEEPIHNTLRAAFLTAFRAMLRKQNVTLSEAVLRRRNFTFTEWGMLVEVEKSKTIQKRRKSSSCQ